jgi:hypothetical protein
MVGSRIQSNRHLPGLLKSVYPPFLSGERLDFMKHPYSPHYYVPTVSRDAWKKAMETRDKLMDEQGLQSSGGLPQPEVPRGQTLGLRDKRLTDSRFTL